MFFILLYFISKFYMNFSIILHFSIIILNIALLIICFKQRQIINYCTSNLLQITNFSKILLIIDSDRWHYVPT